MKALISVVFSLLIYSYLHASVTETEKHYFNELLTKTIPANDTSTMIKAIPDELIVTQAVNDSDVLVIKYRCVVLAKYSECELAEIERNSKSVAEWEAFYDDYLFYNDDVSMFICERSMVKIESGKKYVQFVFSTGKKITIDRMKSAGKLFFFNPANEVRQCNSSAFDSRKYTNF